MSLEKKAKKFVQFQQSLHLYKKPQQAFVDVLKNFSEEEFNLATQNLILMVLHEGALGQVMHFEPKKQNFQIMQLTIPKNMPISIMRYVIAHEFGHVFQGRNWGKADGSKLEIDADNFAKKIGFPRKDSFKKWMNTERTIK